MDHIPIPFNPCGEHGQVSYMCRDEFQPERETVSAYPARRGYDKDHLIENLELDEDTLLDLDRFLQEWLFFVFLHQVFRCVGINVDHNSFTHRNTEGKLMITTTALPKYIQQWYLKNKKETQEESKAKLHAVTECIREVNFVVDKLHQASMASSGNMLSVIALGETLSYARTVIYDTAIPEAWPKHDLPLFRMFDNDWCPNKTAMLEKLFTTSSLLYISLMKQTDGSDRPHDSCTKTACNTHNINRETYVPLHSSYGCSCELIGPSQDQLSAAIDDGGFPIVNFRNGILEVMKFRPELEYTAISHVWSDGMGNLHANKLPLCQINRLHHMITELNGQSSVLFWMDTLCVPWTNDENNRRRTAIGRMRQTYEEAKNVLVISADLTHTSPLASPMERLFRIACSGWMRRLWTLQEGVLARVLHFQFSDGPFSMDNLTGQITPTPDSFISLVEADALQISENFRRFSMMGRNQIEEIYNALQWRNTSWQQDEALCLSIILDLDTEKIATTEGEDRMWTLLEMKANLPATLMFAPGTRIQKDGYRWAPKSMMHKEGFTMPLDMRISPAIQGKYGLMVALPGFILHPRRVPNKDISFFRANNDSSTYRVGNLATYDDGPSWTVDGPWNIPNPAIIVGSGLSDLLDDENGTLVSIYHSQGGVYFTDYHSRVHVHRESHEGLRDVIDFMWDAEAKKDDVTANLGFADKVLATQKWLVR